MFFRVISVIDRLPQALDRVTNSRSTEIDIGHGSECRLLAHQGHSCRLSEWQLPTRLSRCHIVPAAAALGHEERFLPPRLSAGFGFGKKTFAGTRTTEKHATV